MNCPICNIDLKPADRGGIEIDCCPQCRGVWVAREELDRILVQPAPFDADWEGDRDALPDEDRVVLRFKENAHQHVGAKPGFWTSLFVAD